MEVVIIIAAVLGVLYWLGSKGSGGAAAPAAPPPPPRPAARPRSAPTRTPTRRGGQAAVWVPLGGSVSVHGLGLPGGVYVGESLQAVASWRGVDPALIDPRLPINTNRPDHAGQHMDYWPSYSDIAPSSRAAYLQWLAAGRPVGAYIGYVFLFFYGIERRVLVDAAAGQAGQDEVPALLAEVERLLELYGDNGSFRSYATEFLATARLTSAALDLQRLEPPRERVGWEVPVEVRLTAGAHAAAGQPLPAPWALAWAVNTPQIPLRTAATRCPEEFAELFIARYAAAHGEGLVIKPNKTKLKVQYRPASSSFGGAIELRTEDVPDVTVLAGPTKKLAALVEEVTEALDGYSRHVGRHDDRTSARAVALLPAELAGGRLPAAVTALLGRIPQAGPLAVRSSQVVALLGTPADGKLPKRDAAAIAAMLEGQGVALEPDVRLGGANFSRHEHVVLWREPMAGDGSEPGEGFAPATVLLHLGVTVSAADGEVSVAEEEHLEQSLEAAFHLPEGGRRRLRAHLRWLLEERPGVAGLKARVGALAPEQRELIARYLVAVAGADGHVSPKEVDSLRRFYVLLGLDPEAIHRDLHSFAAAPAAGGPGSLATVLTADADQGDQPIRGEVLLDERRLAEVMASTAQVAEVLTDVFVAEAQDEEPDAPEDDDRGGGVEADCVAGLDAAHTMLVRRLATQPAWSRSAFDALAAEADLLPAGAIETVNDAAFAVSDGPLLEGDEPVELDGHVLKELLDA
jgi:uncharacterized tellurite resistance protein B-like protein